MNYRVDASDEELGGERDDVVGSQARHPEQRGEEVRGCFTVPRVVIYRTLLKLPHSVLNIAQC